MKNRTAAVAKSLIQGFFQLYPGEAAPLLNTFSIQDILKYLQAEPIARAAQLFTRLNSDIAASLIEQMDAKFFSQLFTTIDPSMASRLLARLDQEAVNKQLSLLPGNVAKELQELMQYPPETAGHLMDPRALTFHPDDTVQQALKIIRATRDRRILHIYIVVDDGKLAAMVPLEEVVFSEPKERLGNLIQGTPVSIQAMSPREDVVQLLGERKLISLPVVDIDGKLLGVIRYDALVTAAKQDASEDLQAMFGAGRDERALLARATHRRHAQFLSLRCEQSDRRHAGQAPLCRHADQLHDPASVAGWSLQGAR